MNIAKAMLLLSVLVSAGIYAVSGEAEKAPQALVAEEGITFLTSGEMKRAVDSKDSIILDARTGTNDDGKRIPGAKSLSPTSSAEEVSKHFPNKASSIVTYCANLKCPASAALAKHLRALGYKDVKEYPEGIQGWIAAGYPVESAVK